MHVVIFRARIRRLDAEYAAMAARIRAWKAHPEHLLAQRAGRERWYQSYSVQVARIERDYRVPSAT